MRRKAAVSGQFYPGRASAIEAFIAREIEESAPKGFQGVIVPHAGWPFSGGAALRALNALDMKENTVFVLFGAVHVADIEKPAVYPEGAWETPLGDISVADELIADNFQTPLFSLSSRPHEGEHSLEVQLPFLRCLAPRCSIIPIAVPPDIHSSLDHYVDFFHRLFKKRPDIRFIASSDLTHYGFQYGDISHGSGASGYTYVTGEKDPLFIEKVNRGEYRDLIPYALTSRSACGPGGMALLTGLFQKGEIRFLEYTTSYDMYPAAGMDSFVSYGTWGLKA